MSKDLLTTIIGGIGAVALAAQTYMSAHAADVYGLSFFVGLGGAVLIAVFGYWSKKGE